MLCVAVRELRAELVNVGTVVRRRLRPDGRSPRLCLCAWALVSEPGWWVNDGPLGDHEVTLGDDGIYRVSDPDAGDWLIEKADEDPTDVVAFRWYPLADDEAEARQAYEDEVGMWEQVLSAAKNYLEGR